jgi:hypothetical protein
METASITVRFSFQVVNRLRMIHEDLHQNNALNDNAMRHHENLRTATEDAMDVVMDEACDYIRAQLRLWLQNPNRFTE